MRNVCDRCSDSGYYLGNGMIITSCDKCDDTEGQRKSAPALDGIDRKSKTYQKAIKDIMSINPDITRKEAVKMFDEAYSKN